MKRTNLFVLGYLSTHGGLTCTCPKHLIKSSCDFN